jgi:glycolate oxidase FAD binding subunit
MSTPIRSLLESMVGPESLVPEEEMDRWLVGGALGALPEAVVVPSSLDEMSELLGRASEEGWKVLPAGLGSWLQGGGPSEVTLVVSTRRMANVHEYEPADLTFTAGSGIPLSSLREITGANGQWLPLDPPGGPVGSLGAAVALGGGGPLAHLYGTVRDHVLGLVMVSGEGKILRWGGKVVKNVAGFDLTRLAIGSWGTLGVVTSVSARLFPIPDKDVTLVLRGPNLRDLVPPARAMALSSLPLAAVELVDPLPDVSFPFMDGSPENGSSGYGNSGGLQGALILRLLGSEAQVGAMESRIRTELSTSGGKLERLEGRESLEFHQALNRWEEGLDLVLRLARLPSHLTSLLEEAEVLSSLASSQSKSGAAAAAGRPICLSAQVGRGVLRVGVPVLSGEADDHEVWVSALRGLRNRLESQEGTLTLSSGPEAIMSEVGAWGRAGPEAEIMAELKKRFDPQKVLAPGRLGL